MPKRQLFKPTTLQAMADGTTEIPSAPAANQQLISPPFDANSFEVDGIVYTASEDISIPRYRRLQKLDLQFGFDASFGGVWDVTTKIKEVVDDRKSISDIAYINEGLRRGLTNIDRNEVYQLHVVALWYNADGEDIINYNHEAIVAKMNRWEAGGLSMGFLFAKAAACVRGFREAWLSLEDPESNEPDQSPSPQ